VSLARRLVDAAARRAGELRLALFRPGSPHTFWIVSAGHNVAKFVDRHMDSIEAQDYDPALVQHLIIDDASTDGTGDLVDRRILARGGSGLRRVHNDLRRGGCANLTRAFREAPAGSIVLQVDADDWLPEPRVLAYLDMLYHDPDLWMTYNSWVFPDGRPSLNSDPIPRRVVEQNSFRDHSWISSHLHTFRRELFDHVEEDGLKDPETGDYWTAAVDMSHYFPMLELAGEHARHVRRITYVYNEHPGSLISAKREHQLGCEKRIRALPRYSRLVSLERG
jgi:glycosyltransferase involved in cell wall biosynthesis